MSSEVGARALQENQTAMLTSNTCSAHSKGEALGRDVEIKITNVDEMKAPIKNTQVAMKPMTVPPLRNQ